MLVRLRGGDDTYYEQETSSIAYIRTCPMTQCQVIVDVWRSVGFRYEDEEQASSLLGDVRRLRPHVSSSSFTIHHVSSFKILTLKKIYHG